jgi:hypothetical protein
LIQILSTTNTDGEFGANFLVHFLASNFAWPCVSVAEQIIFILKNAFFFLNFSVLIVTKFLEIIKALGRRKEINYQAKTKKWHFLLFPALFCLFRCSSSAQFLT